MNFKDKKDSIIFEIVIGPKSNLDDKDLRLFLIAHGYDLSKVQIVKSKASYR